MPRLYEKLKEQIRSESFIKSIGSGELSPKELLAIFSSTAKKLLREDFKSGYLIYPIKPREIDARHVMCEALSAKKINHMIECPIHSPTSKLKNRASFTDLSIFLKNGIIDIEFKKSPSDIKRDFPKLLSSNSLGCSSFYLFNGKSINKQLPLISSRYQEAYETARDNLNKQNLLKNKWYIFFLIAHEERKIIYQVFNDVEQLDFLTINTGRRS